MQLPVLVVDDDQSNREALRSLLEDARYDVRDVGDGAAAFDAMRTSQSGLVVLLDLVLHGEMSSSDIIRSIADDAQLARRHALVIITASPRLVTPDLAQMLSDLHAPVVTKPFDLDVLLHEVASAANRAHAASL